MARMMTSHESKILITGANGLLGSSLVPYLEKHKYEVIRQSRKEKGSLIFDLSNFDQTYVMISKVQPDIVVHLAALTDVDKCQTCPNEAYLANVKTVENLVNSIEKLKLNCHLVYISTDQVYGGYGPHKESDVSLLNYYAFSKYTGELLASKVSSTILRTNFVGKSLSADRKSLTDWLIEASLSNREVTVFEDISFSPLSLSKLVEILETILIKRLSGTFNLGCTGGASKAEFAIAFANALGLKKDRFKIGTSNSVNLDAIRPKDMRLDSTSFEDAFGIVLPTITEIIDSLALEYGS